MGGLPAYSSKRYCLIDTNKKQATCQLRPQATDDMSSDRPLPDREPSPPLGSWPRMYALVIGFDLLVILLLTLFTRYFA